MVPTVSKAGVLTNITRDGGDVPFTTRVIKGIEYAFFSASAGAYVTTYAADMNPPTVTSTLPANGATGVSQGTPVSATFSEALDATTLTTATFELRDPGNTVVYSTVIYNAATETAILTPAATLSPSTTYTATLKGGSTDPRIKDLSGNALVDDVTWSFTTAAGAGCPCSGWSSSTTPTNPSASDPNAVELGVKFRSDLDGFITGIRFYKGTGNTGTHVGNLWTATGQLLATATFANETATGWQEVNFASPIEVTADTVYVASYHAPNGGYAFDTDYFAGTGFQNGPLYFLRDGENAGNGVYVYSSSTSFPTNTWQATNYWVDAVFTTNSGPDTTPPTIPGNLSAVSEGTTQVTLTWTASTDNVGVTAYEVERCQGGGCTNFAWISTVTGTSFGDSELTAGTTYQYRVRASDAAGNLSDYSNVVTVTTQVSVPPLTITTPSLPSSTLNVSYSTALVASGGTVPYMWSIDSGSLPTGLSLDSATGVISGTPTAAGTFSFTAQANDSSNPQQTAIKDLSITVVEQAIFTIWSDTAVPATPADPDTSAVELGVKFRSDLDGYITGIRFYKSSTNTGTHTGSLWTSGGQLLAQAIFTNESTFGWQQVDFVTPVAITANTVYVASYHAPNGRYATDVGYFATAGVDNDPLHALQDGESGGNGVYVYGAGGFPTGTWQASNYWVDVVFTTSIGPDTTPPTVTAVLPLDGTTDVATSTVVTATFSEEMDPATIGGSTFELRDAADAPMAAVIYYDSGTSTATLTPSAPLANSETYTASVLGGTGGVTDLAGNALAATSTWLFTTAAPSGDTTPPTVTAVLPLDGTTDVATSTVVTATFSEEMDPATIGGSTFELRDAADAPVAAVISYDSGTSTATLTPSAPLVNSATYTASVLGGIGGVTDLAGNLLAATSTWSFTTAAPSGDTTPPTVTAVLPLDGTTDVDTSTVVTATFSEEMDPATIGGSTFELRDAADAPVAAVISYDSGTSTATLTPSAPLANSETYTASVLGGTGGVTDLAGNLLAATSTWSFTTTLPSAGPEPAGWYAGDMHVHRSCGGSPYDMGTMLATMDQQNLAVISLLADMGNGEVQDPDTDLPLVNGQNDPVSTPDRIVHWDAEWHWDATYTQFPHQALGGHIVALGLTEAHQIWEEYTAPIFQWVHGQDGIAGFAHMQYLDDGIPQSLDCCKPIEYPVEVALGSADFISEDVNGSDSFIRAYYRLLNTGFRPGFAAGSDFPCGQDVGALLTYVQVAGGVMNYRGWIDGIAQGRTVISRNGHNEFLSLTVNGSATPGDEINLTGGGSVSVAIQWTANQNLSGTIELVKNGVVVNSVSRSVSPGAPASLNTTVDFTSSGWLAARRMDGNGHQVHTAAVFVTVDGAPVRASVADAEFYVQWMDNLLQKTSPGGAWNSYFPTSLTEAQARYQQAKAIYQQIALEAGGLPPPLTITTQALPGSTLNVSYSTALAASGGTAPYMWSIDSGSLPTGLSLDSATGVISGTPTAVGTFSFTVQANDSGNPQQTAIKDLSITVVEQATFTIWPGTAVPATPADPDTAAVELGVKFRSDLDGYITGIRFYKSSTNTGTHTGSLWTSGGQLLAQATFTNESTSGWQQVDFVTPVAITANTVYVASYHAPTGRYATDIGYFATAGVDNAPLHALQDGVSGGNGVYLYGAGGFPTDTWNASNYWVDVVFQEQ